MKWLRLYTEITDDRKLRRHDPAVRWVWITLLVMARKSPHPGRLLLSEEVPVTPDDIADEAAVDRSDVDRAIEIFTAQKMIHKEDETFVVDHWDERQFSSDSSTARVRRHRAKEDRCSNADETLHETPQKRFDAVTPTVTVTPPDTEYRVQKQNAAAVLSDTARVQGLKPESVAEAAAADGGMTKGREPSMPATRRYSTSLHDQFFRSLRHLPSSLELDMLASYDLPEDVVGEALREAAACGARTTKYVCRILDNWVEQGVSSVDDVERLRAEWAAGRASAAGVARSRGDPKGRAIPSAQQTAEMLRGSPAWEVMTRDDQSGIAK